MLSRKTLSLFLSLFPLSACASAAGTFAPLGLDHPANALAPELPIQDPAGFLYSDDAQTPATGSSAPSDVGASQAPMGAYVCPMHHEVSSDLP